MALGHAGSQGGQQGGPGHLAPIAQRDEGREANGGCGYRPGGRGARGAAKGPWQYIPAIGAGGHELDTAPGWQLATIGRLHLEPPIEIANSAAPVGLNSAHSRSAHQYSMYT